MVCVCVLVQKGKCEYSIFEHTQCFLSFNFKLKPFYSNLLFTFLFCHNTDLWGILYTFVLFQYTHVLRLPILYKLTAPLDFIYNICLSLFLVVVATFKNMNRTVEKMCFFSLLYYVCVYICYKSSGYIIYVIQFK